MKKVLISVGAVLIVLAVFATVFFQLYIFHYNRGNEFYELGQYEKAAAEYEKALECFVPRKKECDIRVNLALSMVATLQIEPIAKLTDEEKTSIIEILEAAIDVLVEDGCAHRDDNDGHDEEAQKLKNELQELIDRLKQSQEPQSGEDGGDSDENQDGGQDGADSDENQDGDDSDENGDENQDGNGSDDGEDELQQQYGEQQEQLQQIMQQGTSDHITGVDEYNVYEDGYIYYNGNCW